MHCNASSQVSPRTAKGGQVSRLWAAVVAWLRPAAATPEWVQADMTAARLHPAAPIAGLVQADMTAADQYAGDEALQLGSNHVSQTAGCCAVQRAGVSAVQAAGRSALQIAGVGTLQITRWEFAGKNCTAMRIVGVAEAGKRYHVCEGTWTLIE